MEEEIEHIKDLKKDLDYIVENKTLDTEVELLNAHRKSMAISFVLNELERLQKEFELLDHECSRLEQKEIILESENEHYKDLIYALEIYYDIKEEDLEKCVKEDR